MDRRKKASMRWETMNAIVDNVLPNLTASEARLLWVYFRHASIRGPINKEQNVTSLGDRSAASLIGISRESVKRTRLILIEKGVISTFVRRNGKTVYILNDQMGEGAPVSPPRERSAPKQGAPVSPLTETECFIGAGTLRYPAPSDRIPLEGNN